MNVHFEPGKLISATQLQQRTNAALCIEAVVQLAQEPCSVRFAARFPHSLHRFDHVPVLVSGDCRKIATCVGLVVVASVVSEVGGGWASSRRNSGSVSSSSSTSVAVYQLQ